MTDSHTPWDTAAYGGTGWQPRSRAMFAELGDIWAPCGVNSEWAPLKAVMLHAPGEELAVNETPDSVQMLEPLDLERAQRQHAALVRAFEAAGVRVCFVEPEPPVRPNQMFVSDLFFMTPEGAILARPASCVRAGEERWVARRLAALGVPILRSISGRGTFEGADAAWLDKRTVLLGCGLRTNREGAAQISAVLGQMGVDTLTVDLPLGTMHLMGMLRFLDRDLALAWPGRLAYAAAERLRASGYRVLLIPDTREAMQTMALNFVTLKPRSILMAAGNPATRAMLEAEGVTCRTVPVDELAKAAGGIGCLTGILHRDEAA